MSRSGDANYDQVNMDLSDPESGSSDNEMFACKNEYKAFKQQFSKKDKKVEIEDQITNEYGGPRDELDEYGGGPTPAQLKFDSLPSKHGDIDPKNSQTGIMNTNHFSREEGDSSRQSKERVGGGREEKRGRIEAEPSIYGERKRSRERSRDRDRTRERRRSGERGSRDDRGSGPRDDNRGSGPRDDNRGSGPRDENRGSGQRDNNRGSGPRDDNRGSGPRDDRGNGPRDDRGNGPRGDRRRSHSRDRGGGRRRSRSRDRSPRRDFGRGGRGDRGERGGRRHDRDEHAKNMEEQMRKAEEMGVEMPKYMKAGAFNPLSYAEQVQKRKMLWSKSTKSEGNSQESETKKEAAVEQQNHIMPEENSKISFNKWETTNFGNNDKNEKFRRLMGIKATPQAPSPKDSNTNPHSNVVRIEQDLEKNYEAARYQTHRNRGLGLGFSNAEPALPASVPESRGVFGGQGGAYPPSGSGGGGMGQIGWNRPSHAMSGGINFIRKPQ